MPNARLVGGTHAGEVVQVHENQPVLKLIRMENLSFPTKEEINGDSIVVKHDTYIIEEFRYGTGHRHIYGFCEPIRMVDGMNMLWDAYQAEVRR